MADLGRAIYCDVIGPGYQPDQLGPILFDGVLEPSRLHSLTYTRVVAVRLGSTRLEFERTICHQYLPQLPMDEYEAAGYTIPLTIDPTMPINSFIFPPITSQAAIQAANSCGSSHFLFTASLSRGIVAPAEETLGPSLGLRRIRRVDAFVDGHPSDVFCAVFLKPSGVYEMAKNLTPQNSISPESFIFAPSAWRHGATVVASSGKTSESEDLTRLFCRLASGAVVALDVQSSNVGVLDGWVRQST